MYSVELLTFSQHPLKSTNLNTTYKIYSSLQLFEQINIA